MDLIEGDRSFISSQGIELTRSSNWLEDLTPRGLSHTGDMAQCLESNLRASRPEDVLGLGRN